jgi:hypothetical protein
VSDPGKLRVGLDVLGAASEGVVEGGFLLAQPQLLMAPPGVAQLLGDFDGRSTTSALDSCCNSY